MKETPIKRGEIYYANMSPSYGCEQSGYRPVLIIQNDKGNIYSPTTIVAALTYSKTKTYIPTHVTVKMDGYEQESTILLEQLRTIDIRRLSDLIGCLDQATMKQIDKAIAISLGITKEENND